MSASEVSSWMVAAPVSMTDSSAAAAWAPSRQIWAADCWLWGAGAHRKGDHQGMLGSSTVSWMRRMPS